MDMATSPGSLRPARPSPPREKRVSFSTETPEIIAAPSKRRQPSVSQRPSWSNVFLLRDLRVRDDPAARSRSLSPGPSILKEISAFKSDASDAQLKQDEHGHERNVHISPMWGKNLKRLPRGRQPKKKSEGLPIPKAKVSRNHRSRNMSPENASPTTLSTRHASPRDDDKFEPTSPHSVVVHPPSPPQSDDEDDDALEDDSSDESQGDESPTTASRQSSLDDIDEMDEVDHRFDKVNIDGPARPHKTAENRSYSQRPVPQTRRSSSADTAERWLRKSSIYGVRSRPAPRVPTRLGSLRA